MKNNNRTIIFLLLFVCFITCDLYGEVIFDGSMNASTTNMKLEGNMDILSEYGRISGDNLFHSFKTFNVNPSEIVTFTSEQAVQNIIARVTGSSFSTINGQINSAIDNANLFLINPQGIIFGENASLNIDGSFYASTADYVASEDTHFYSMIHEDEVLFCEKPTSFGFLSDNPQKMNISGSYNKDHEQPTLSVNAEKNISLIAGGFEIIDAKFLAKQGTINIASVSSKGNVDFDDFDKSEDSLQGDIQINHSIIDVSGDGSGNIYIRGGRVVIENESSIIADNDGSSLGGTTKIYADTLTIDHSNIYSDAQQTGDGGKIQIQVNNSIMIANQTRIYADATSRSSNAGNAGTIVINGQHIQILNKTIISTDTYGEGMGGSILIAASDRLSILDQSKIFTVAQGIGKNAGNGGIINIQSPDISIINKSIVSSDTQYGYGDGGKIVLSGIDNTHAESIIIYDSKLYSGSVEEGYGNGGLISIIGENISFINGAVIGSESRGRGKGGDVQIIASELNFWGFDSQNNASTIYTNAQYLSKDAGDAGNININCNFISFKDQSGLIANTEGPGKAGQIELIASSVELKDKSSISSASTGKENAGNGGEIKINAFSDITLNNSDINTSSFGDGFAGNISIVADGIFLDNQSGILSESKASINGGTAGKISIMTGGIIDINNSYISTEAVNTSDTIVNLNQDKDNGRLFVCTKNKLQLNNGKITSSVLGGLGNGGNIDIVPEMVLMNHSQIIANAYEGNGGNIHIIADQFIQSADSVVQASSKYGFDGDIFIDAPETTINSDLVKLPENYLDASQWLRTPCSLRTSKDISRLVISGREAVPKTVDDLNISPALQFLTDDGSDPLRIGKIDLEFFNSSPNNKAH